MMISTASEFHLPSREELAELFREKHGEPGQAGWSPRRRFQFGYYIPADVYEAVIKTLVFDGCSWVDVGGGHSIFPDNPRLAHSLVSRCSLVVAVDPSENVYRNAFVHERVRCQIGDYRPDRQFDLASLRMVAEHIAEPENAIQDLNRLLRPQGFVLVFTANRFSPITLISRLVPFKLHHPIKKLFWGGDEKDTFPVQYKMNTRRSLHRLFEANGFEEHSFAFLDDLAVFHRFRYMNYVELILWRVLRQVGLRYPENCLLGVYRKK